ncbi:MAG: hypothetical protein WC741_05170 [Patescibacteria group bacterium]|jgi:hypothetical protein
MDLNTIQVCSAIALPLALAGLGILRFRHRSKEGSIEPKVKFEKVESFQDVEDRQFFQALRMHISLENIGKLFGMKK